MEQEKDLTPAPEEQENAPEGKPKEETAKSAWQIQKECWYDKVPLTLKQLDIIIGICVALLAVIFLCVGLDAMGIADIF